MANEAFGTYVLGLPSATTPLTGPEVVYVNQASISGQVNIANVAISLLPLQFTAWGTYTPVVSTTSGTITSTGTVGGRFFHAGKIVFVEITASITNNGTGTGAILFTLPVNALRGVTGDVPAISGQSSVPRKSLNASYNSASQIAVFNYDGTYPGQTGTTIAVAGMYESV